MMIRRITLFILLIGSSISAQEHSVARDWNEMVLYSIRNDFARPTVHARNLFHTSAAMYDAWAAFTDENKTFFLGNTIGETEIPFEGFTLADDRSLKEAREEAISYAAYRLILHRFARAPGARPIRDSLVNLMDRLGYDVTYNSSDYTSGNPADLGNYIAEQVIVFGFSDGANERRDYSNKFYEPVNPPLITIEPGNPDVVDPNRWQPLTLEVFIDQSGNVIPGNTPDFLGPEWGYVVPFALSEKDLREIEKEGNTFWMYNDPQDPPYIGESFSDTSNQLFKWNFSLVSVWGSHLDSNDSTMWDISPGSIGNNPAYPDSFIHYDSFYDYYQGGDASRGHELNPVTGAPYEPNRVKRGDYARVLAEFWADGPDSETPPGHWFTLLNFVSDHPEFEKKYQGRGEIMDDLEWDVKSYFMMGGAMHDAAVSTWSIKGYYDYLRPISAIRYMCDQGQSTYPDSTSYHPDGIPLEEGYVELITEEDDVMLRGVDNEHLGKIKLYTWRGPDFIGDPESTEAGVGWIRGENWWPYQRPSFVSPPFAGYLSGHSTFSRAASELLKLLTGDEFFPGGMGEFVAKKNEFLVFEDGPSEDVRLQWATYKDASDQTSLSRIWGGIHPPADDIKGRQIGITIGSEAFLTATEYFSNELVDTDDAIELAGSAIFPNLLTTGESITIDLGGHDVKPIRIDLISMEGRYVKRQVAYDQVGNEINLSTDSLTPGRYYLKVVTSNGTKSFPVVLMD